MKTNLFNTGLAVLLTFSAGLAMAQNQPQVIDIPLSKPGEPASLEISIISARIWRPGAGIPPVSGSPTSTRSATSRTRRSPSSGSVTTRCWRGCGPARVR